MGDNETIYCNEIKESSDKNVENLCGLTSLQELLYLITKCDLSFGNVSGVMHLGAITDTPVVTLLGPTDPTLYKPYSKTLISLNISVNVIGLFMKNAFMKMLMVIQNVCAILVLATPYQ